MFFKLIFFLRMGDAVGWIRKEREKAPATLEKSGSNSLNYPKWIVPSIRLRTRAIRTKNA